MGRAPCCDKSKVKRGPWTPVEDLRLVSFIQKHGHPNWRALPKLAGLLRCGKSCRLRWINYLRPDVKRGNFSPEEEEKIITLHQSMGNKWSKIASHLPGRTDNEIKNVWNTHLKKKIVMATNTDHIHRDPNSSAKDKDKDSDQNDDDPDISKHLDVSPLPFSYSANSGPSSPDYSASSSCISFLDQSGRPNRGPDQESGSRVARPRMINDREQKQNRSPAAVWSALLLLEEPEPHNNMHDDDQVQKAHECWSADQGIMNHSDDPIDIWSTLDMINDDQVLGPHHDDDPISISDDREQQQAGEYNMSITMKRLIRYLENELGLVGDDHHPPN